MKRRIIFVAAVLLILAGIFLLVKVGAETLTPKGKGALQINTNIKAAAFLDNKPIGDAPLCLGCEDQTKTIDATEHDLRVVPEDKNLEPFTAKIKINKNALTAVERTFLPGALSSSYVLTLEETNSSNPQLFLASIPEGALITIDGESKGVTPLLIESLSESEHEVEIQKQGFAKKTIRIRAVPSHKLVLNVVLGTEAGEGDLIKELTPSGEITPTAKPLPDNSVLIKDTPTGFLRVRKEASISSTEIGRVSPGEVYPLIDENENWYQIELDNGDQGWVSATYAEKTSE